MNGIAVHHKLGIREQAIRDIRQIREGVLAEQHQASNVREAGAGIGVGRFGGWQSRKCLSISRERDAKLVPGYAKLGSSQIHCALRLRTGVGQQVAPLRRIPRDLDHRGCFQLELVPRARPRLCLDGERLLHRPSGAVLAGGVLDAHLDLRIGCRKRGRDSGGPPRLPHTFVLVEEDVGIANRQLHPAISGGRSRAQQRILRAACEAADRGRAARRLDR